MSKLIIGILIVFLLVFAVSTYFADLGIMLAKDKTTLTISGGATERAYAAMIVTDDADIRALALKNAATCNSADKACQVYTNYLFMIQNLTYMDDPSENEISGVDITLNKKGGDCEDLSILYASLLENLGIETRLVLTHDHAYVLACGVTARDIRRLFGRDKRFEGFNVAKLQIAEENIDGEPCIPADVTMYGMAYPGLGEQDPALAIVEPKR